MLYSVYRYSQDTLKECFVNALADRHEHIVENKQHLTCLTNYFDKIKTQTIIVEQEYVNRDFLEDYSSYYVRSYTEYRRNCHRLHFFKNQFSERDFDDLLRGDKVELSAESLQDNYQGYMVLKPLPTTIIGRTCLVTYPGEGKRHFPAIRKYAVSLYGINLEVESLAYQEQDSIVSACASSAIWSVFHGTGKMFQHRIPSPVEITKWATKYFPFSNRHFPNQGLTGEQMALAIREVGLEPYLYNVDDIDTLKATVYAYLKGRIPLVLGFSLFDVINGEAKPRGGHAVAICGFCTGGEVSNTYRSIEGLQLSASRIDKLYVHDDQIGPFAKMETDGVLKIENKDFPALKTTWPSGGEDFEFMLGIPQILIIPLYHKIRIPLEKVQSSTNSFNRLCLLINDLHEQQRLRPVLPRFEWDIHLITISDFKHSIFSNSQLAGEYKVSILTQRLPKYLWRAAAIIKGQPVFEFLMDATDIDQGTFFIGKIIYDPVFDTLLSTYLNLFDVSEEMDMTYVDMVKSFGNSSKKAPGAQGK